MRIRGLKVIGIIQGAAQNPGNIAGKKIAAHGYHFCFFYPAALVAGQVHRARAEIHHDDAELFIRGRQAARCTRPRLKNKRLHVKPRAADAADEICHDRFRTDREMHMRVNDVTGHADRIGNKRCRVVIKRISLHQVRDHAVIVTPAPAVVFRVKSHRQARDALHILRRHFIFTQHKTPFAVHGMQILSGQCRRHGRNLAPAHCFGFGNSLAD